MNFLTKQEIFWHKNFGKEYTLRNKKSEKKLTIVRDLIKNKISFYSVIEFGSNIGLNLDAIKKNFPKVKTFGIEINPFAFSILKKKHDGYNDSVLNYNFDKKFDLVISSGFLIHQSPRYLNLIYQKIYESSNRYIYLSEYFNPDPVSLKYRGKLGKLFKRDFAKELWNLFPNLKLVDYGFHWKHDPIFKKNIDSKNYFLFQK